MATTVTIQPNGVFARQTSGKWGNANRLWDGNESTAPTSQNGWIALNLDLSWIPAGARITKITVRYVYYRGGNGVSTVFLYCTNSSTHGGLGEVLIREINLYLIMHLEAGKS